MQQLVKDTKMWFESFLKDESTYLVLNHGQHLDIPCLLGKTNRIFVGLVTKNQESKFCLINKETFVTIEKNLRLIQIKPENAPKYLQLPEGSYQPRKMDSSLIG